ncbi:Antibiotic biosynthesis monooxygenase [Pseudodesulfovibrio mercurii]|uniref:Antibiotic biosynthesis monooxygenase n=1 Tax=Pseudodesulfovibrio mercurii TaxID=641491 RepID=F0JEL0_9BACT|nr:putative quinol monooxygenase [Pseudodesulfovibrio mercurii]EGB14739.1 Antibiotic biosynthesis monooxygenase [Pseudodesulfovibrio mercurii]
MAKTYVTAVITAREGCAAALESELRKVVDAVRAEPGCLRYDLHRAGGVFLFYEIWASPAHLEAHGRTPHMAAMHAATADLTARPSEVALWEAVETAG